jgi:hypothetical protein
MMDDSISKEEAPAENPSAGRKLSRLEFLKIAGLASLSSSSNPLRYLVEPEIDHLLAKIDAIGVVKDSFVAVQATPDSKHFRLAFTTSGIPGFSSAEKPYTRIELTPIHYPDHMGMDIRTAYHLVQMFGGTKLSNVPHQLAYLLLTGLTTTTVGGIAGYVSRGSSEGAVRGAGLGFGLGMLLGATGCAQITVEALARSERRELAYEHLPTIEALAQIDRHPPGTASYINPIYKNYHYETPSGPIATFSLTPSRTTTAAPSTRTPTPTLTITITPSNTPTPSLTPTKTLVPNLTWAPDFEKVRTGRVDGSGSIESQRVIQDVYDLGFTYAGEDRVNATSYYEFVDDPTGEGRGRIYRGVVDHGPPPEDIGVHRPHIDKHFQPAGSYYEGPFEAEMDLWVETSETLLISPPLGSDPWYCPFGFGDTGEFPRGTLPAWHVPFNSHLGNDDRAPDAEPRVVVLTTPVNQDWRGTVSPIPFPYGKWVNLLMRANADRTVEILQDGILVSSHVIDFESEVALAGGHWGLYAGTDIRDLIIGNDNLVIRSWGVLRSG